MTEPLPLFRHQALAARSGIEGAVLVTRTRLSWLLTSIFCCLLVMGVIAAAFVRLPRTQEAPAIAISNLPPSKISASRPGRILAVEVEDGQHVHAGDVVARISNARDEEMIARDKIERQASAESESLTGQRLRDQETADAAELLNLETDLHVAVGQHSSLQDQVADRKEALRIAEEEFAKLDAVTARGFVSNTERNQRWLNLLEQRSSYRDAVTKVATSEDDISKLERKIARFRDDARLRQFAARNDQLTALARSRSSRAGDQFIIRAPVSGIVSTVVVAPGATVNANTTIATVVPPNAVVQVVLYVSSGSIGQIARGQPVQLRFDSFPYQEYGSIPARVVEVSPTVVLPGEGLQFFNLKDPSFKVVARIEGAPRNGGRIIPGMTGQALIVTGMRGFFGLLFR